MSDNGDLLGKRSLFSTKDKKGLLFVAGIGALIIVSFIVVKITNPQKGLKPPPTLKPLSISDKLLGEDEFQKFQEALKNQNDVIATIQTEREADKAKIAALEKMLEGFTGEKTNEKTKVVFNKAEPKKQFDKELDKLKTKATELTDQSDPDQLSGFRYPPSPTMGQFDSSTHSRSSRFNSNSENQGVTEQLVGGVGWVEGTPEPPPTPKKQRRYYLSPSFFPAKLLTGIDAMTSKQGKDNLEQVFFRVDAPAVLPNQIKKDLSGCFVVANVHGNLAKERAAVQAVNLSCLSPDGKTVIDEKILGFVTDNGDGKRDLAGNVVSKDGSKMAWLFAASVVGELGKSVSISSYTQRDNILGTSTTLDPDKVAQQSLGASVQGTTDSYKEIITEYIKQSGPVIEMGPLKDATIFIQKGVWLNIKERETDEAV